MSEALAKAQNCFEGTSEFGPSPFIEGTDFQFVYDSTCLGWLKECDRKYYYYGILGLRKKSLAFETEETVHLDFGGAYAKAKELYHKALVSGHSYDDAADIAVDYVLRATWIDGKPWESNHAKKTRDSLLRTLIWNLDKYKDDPAKTLVLSNGTPAIELSFKFELDYKIQGRPYLLSGHLDRIANFGGDLFVFDDKTTGGGIGPYYFDSYNPHNQMSLYVIAAKVIYQVPIAGVIIEAAQVLTGTSEFARGITMRSDAQLNEYLVNTQYWFKRAEQNVLNNYWPMNEKSCHDFGGCPFRSVCSKDPAVRDKFLETDFVRAPWNPLAIR